MWIGATFNPARTRYLQTGFLSMRLRWLFAAAGLLIFAIVLGRRTLRQEVRA